MPTVLADDVSIEAHIGCSWGRDEMSFSGCGVKRLVLRKSQTEGNKDLQVIVLSLDMLIYFLCPERKPDRTQVSVFSSTNLLN